MSAPIFILSAARSYSSIFCGVLGQHPQLYGLPEVNLFLGDTIGDLIEHFISREKMHRMSGLLRVLSQLHDGEQTEASVERAWDWLFARNDWSCTQLGQYLAQQVAPRALVDKSPSTVTQPEYLARLLQTFPDCRCIHLTRHPRGVGQSFFKDYRRRIEENTRQNKSNHRLQQANPKRVERHWIESHRNILAFLEKLPAERIQRVRGEDFMADPIPALFDLCGWLGIDDSPEAIEAMMHPEHSPYAGYGPRNARWGNNPNFQDDARFRPAPPKALPSLDGPLEWIEGSTGFSAETRRLAHLLGYT